MNRRISGFWLALLAMMISCLSFAQQEAAREAVMKALIENDRVLRDKTFASPAHSPIPVDQLGSFHGLNYFEPDITYKVYARFTRDEIQEPVVLQMTNGKEAEFLKYGTLTFSLFGKVHSLTVFRNQNLPELSEYPRQLFAPFSDLTNGYESNSNGRYLLVNDQRNGDDVEIDFNRAINPYSAYNNKYVSVLPPTSNSIPAAIRAGEQKYGVIDTTMRY